MALEFEQLRMHTTVHRIRPLPSGEEYEAKVTNVNDHDENEIPLPKDHSVWGLAWGKSYKEAEEKAVNRAINLLKSLGVEVGEIQKSTITHFLSKRQNV
ncbi:MULTISPECIES: hypothetical protein [unclassified Enterobacter]|uniref:hypothetical protein n=1 Tax=unclassified Enterobacter TaxID=2608935 RepID=UPI000EFA19F8|nr:MULTISPECIES: hypothetical protein [unclassified Enterobacter]